MRQSTITIKYPCSSCEQEYEIKVWPIRPAVLNRLPEDCCPEEGGEYDPEKCPKCEQPAVAETVWRLMDDERQAQEEAAADYEYERRREKYYE